jgi:hypothetical protein
MSKPTKARKDPKSKLVQVRVTEAQQKAFKAYFGRNNTSVSDGIRSTVIDKIQEAE